MPPALFEALSAQVRAWKTQAVQLERDGALLHALDEERILAESGSRHVDEMPRFGQKTEKETILCKFKFSNSSVFPEKETILNLDQVLFAHIRNTQCRPGAGSTA